MSNKYELTLKKQRFINEYLVDFNATQAAIRAGYSKKTAYSIGHENLRKPEVVSAIAAKKAEKTKKLDLTAEMVLQGLLDEAMDHSEGSTQSARVQAWTQLGRYLALFKDRIDTTGDLGQRMREAEERIRQSKETSCSQESSKYQINTITSSNYIDNKKRLFSEIVETSN